MPLFVRAAVHRVIEKIGADATVVQQGVAFGRGAVADDGFPLAFGLNEKLQQAPLGLFDLLGEALLGFQPVKSLAELAFAQLRHAAGDETCCVCVVGAVDA